MPPEIAKLTEWALRDPERIEIGARRSPAETVTHALYPVAAVQKFDLLLELLKQTNFDSVLIFVRTKHAADRIAARLEHRQHTRRRAALRTARRASGSRRWKVFATASTR